MKEDIILILAFVAIIVFGYFLMAKIDDFLENNRKSIKSEDEEVVQQPSCIMLKDDLTDDEIMDEIKSFREKNESICVVVYDSSCKDFEKIFSGDDSAQL